MPDNNPLPDVLMLMGSQCPWCPAVREALEQLLAEGLIATLETVNIEEQPELAQTLKVRSVPWVRIGSFELEGTRSKTELREWARKAAANEGLAEWLDELLSSGKLAKVQAHLDQDPGLMDDLLSLFANSDTQLNSRIGISAIIEGLEGTTLLKQQYDRISALLTHQDDSIRGDACHFLSLTGSPKAADRIRPLLEDTNPDIRQIARDSLQHLESARVH